MSAITAILHYDLKRFLRDKLMLAFSVLVLIMYVVIVQVSPDDIQPKWVFATTEEGAELVEDVLKRMVDEKAGDVDQPTIKVVRFKTEGDLVAAFKKQAGIEDEKDNKKEGEKKDDESDDEYFVGFAFPADAKAKALRGEKPEVHLYVDESMPRENQELAELIGQQIALATLSQGLDIDETQKEDALLGKKPEMRSFKEQMRSMFALVILMMEMLAFASLLSKEIKSGTVHALLTTTVSLPTYFAGKMIFGVLLAFTQAYLVSIFTGALTPAPLLLTAYLLIGAVMFTGFGIIVGSRGHDLMEVLMFGMLFMLPGLIPVVTAILPGGDPLWVQVLPTYPLVQGMLTAAESNPDFAPGALLAWSLAWTAGLLLVGVVALRRRLK